MLQSTMMTQPLTLTSLLDRSGSVFADVEVISNTPSKTLHRTNYGEVARRARQLGNALQKAGIQPGDRVATLMWNHYAHLECYFAIPAIGAVLHTLNLRLHADDIGYIANHAEDRILIIDDILLPLYREFADTVNFERVIVLNYGGESHEFEDYEDFLASGDDTYTPVEIDENWACGMCYTSGTTGKPKGVLYGHRSSILHAMGFALPDAGNLSFRDTVCPVVPMFHAKAWGLPYAAAMVGSRLVLPGPHLDAESLLDLYAETGVNFTAGVPTIWMRVYESLTKEPQRWELQDKLRMFVGGSATPSSLIEKFRSIGMTVQTVWGMTETSPIATVTSLRPEIDELDEAEQRRYRARAGIPLPMVELRVKTEEGQLADWDGETVGELQARGPWITGSYYNRPDAADSFTDDGWFCTGDVAALTPLGYVQISDRTKDLIKSGGEWISSVDLENELMAHPDVAEAVVIAVHHPKWMERPLAVVVKRDGAEVSADDLKAHLKGKFANWWIPNDVAFVEEIPKTSTGKFMKLKVREQFADWEWSN
ncbi:fatty-acyl-CoA synthase [Litorivivens lipolytica]|uniref:Fatty-acyl-CoA synthase n=1 Tax=Litorivivens lipolytica TaxID=1524264 RepID=A0A7W4W5X5_9GAMM|nr:long-chain fatty acid--CoA ligase [Litorivivens lipolytica]MBB3047683.1 fatty-acyl-CoA synthase [Litorivivens lipolytica]